MRRIAPFVFCVIVALLCVSPAVAREKVENPLYKNWAGFKPGTTVVYRAITSTPNHTITTTTTSKLIEISDAKIVIEHQITIKNGDQVVENPVNAMESPRYFTLPASVDPAKFGQPEGVLEKGVDKIKLAGTEYQAHWYKAKNRVEAGDTFSQIWTPPAIPGGLLKSKSDTPATKSVTEVELVELKVVK